jgi:hypothetical protein
MSQCFYGSERNGLEFDTPDVSGSSRVIAVELRNQIRGMDIVPRFPRVVLNAKVLPFNQVPKLPVDHLAVQDLFYNPFLFTIYDIRGRRTVNGSSVTRVNLTMLKTG